MKQSRWQSGYIRIRGTSLLEIRFDVMRSVYYKFTRALQVLPCYVWSEFIGAYESFELLMKAFNLSD